MYQFDLWMLYLYIIFTYGYHITCVFVFYSSMFYLAINTLYRHYHCHMWLINRRYLLWLLHLYILYTNLCIASASSMVWGNLVARVSGSHNTSNPATSERDPAKNAAPVWLANWNQVEYDLLLINCLLGDRDEILKVIAWHILRINSTCTETDLTKLPQNTFVHKSTFGVMAWCGHAISHCLNQCWSNIYVSRRRNRVAMNREENACHKAQANYTWIGFYNAGKVGISNIT